MMGTKLQKNAIMAGYINSYCLVCECYFDTLDETGDHILEGTHAEKLLAHPYLEKYNDNHIRKVNKGYFCEFCGLLLATAAKVSLHIQDKSHHEKKGRFLLRRLNGYPGVVAFDDVFVSDRAWHSLTDETCAICNEEFNNESIHKTESGHLLKLVQNKVEFGAENSVYRKTDDSSFQCLTCNSVFSLSSLNDHFTDSEHKKLYAKCQEEMKKLSKLNKPKDTSKSTKIDTKETKDQKVPKIPNVEKETKPVDKNHNNVAENSNTKKVEKPENDSYKDLVLKTETKTPEDEATVYANGNNLTYNAGNTNAFCRVCETKLPATLRSMKEHVNGKEHKNKLAKLTQLSQAAKAKPQITKQPLSKFVRYCVNLENLFHNDMVINDKYCLSLASFVTITKNGSRFRCQLCEVNMYNDDTVEHLKTSRHERNMKETPVITSVSDTEFVREVRPNIYHCGFCNLIIPRWEEVGSHLQAREHKDNKDECAWRLQRHLPSVMEHRQRQEMDFLQMMFVRHLFDR